MKKLTAKIARNLSNAYANRHIETFQEAIDIIVTQSKLGMTNCFLDSSIENLHVINRELLERGFKCNIDSTGEDSTSFLSVEW